MLEAIIKGDVNSIAAKLELKFDEFINSNLQMATLIGSANYFAVPRICNIVFVELQFPKSYNKLIYSTTKEYKSIFTKLGSSIDTYNLALNIARRILINRTSLALLMLLYNQQFREFCNVTESRTEILRHLKLEISKHVAL